METKPKLISTYTIEIKEWQEKKIRLKEKYPDLTDTDLEYEEGKVEQLFDRIHARIGRTIGKTKEGLLEFIEKL